MPRTLAALVLALCAGCAINLQRHDLDRLERSVEARTVALEEGYTLWSPFATAETAAWVAMIDEELSASQQLFGARSDERIMLVLVPLEGLGPQLEAGNGQVSVSRADRHPLHGLAGAAGSGGIVIYVTPDQVLDVGNGPMVAHRGASDYRGTLRHELAHVHAEAAGLSGSRWFSEGVADLAESLSLEEGQLVDRGPGDVTLALARSFPEEQWGIVRLLDWHEDGERIAAGEEPVDKVSRTLCGLFVRFLVERQGPGTPAERLAAVGNLSRAQLLALEPAWRAWLARATAERGGGLSRDRT